jgi:hypothetical protein
MVTFAHPKDYGFDYEPVKSPAQMAKDWYEGKEQIIADRIEMSKTPFGKWSRRHDGVSSVLAREFGMGSQEYVSGMKKWLEENPSPKQEEKIKLPPFDFEKYNKANSLLE